MNLLRTLKLSHRLAALIGIFSLGFLVYGAWSFKTLNEVKVNGPVYQDIVQGKDLIADALPPPIYIIESYLVTLQLAAADPSAAAAADTARLIEHLGALRRQHAERSRFWSAQGLDADLAELLRRASEPAAVFYAEAFEHLIPALAAQDRAAIARSMQHLQRSYDRHRLAVDRMVALAAQRASATEAEAHQHIRDAGMLLMLILLGSLGLGLAGAALISRSISQPLSEAVEIAKHVAAGDMSDHIGSSYRDEPGLLLTALGDMNQSLNAMLAARNASEQDLRRSKELTEQLIASANVMVVGLGRHGEVLIFNTEAELITGYRRERVIGRIWCELPLLAGAGGALWPGPGEPERLAAMPRTHEQGIVTAAGAERLVSWQNSVLEQDGGSIALLSFGIDVTEQRRDAQAAIEARELAEAANRSKSEFLANMSHEIRTPMNAVIGMTQLTLNTTLDARQRNYLEKVNLAAHGLLGIINDILDFSKIEAGKLRFEYGAFRLRDMLERLAALETMKAQQKGLELLFDLAPDLPQELVGDAMRLDQVVLNLVNNAIKFTEQGEILLSIRLLERSAEHALLRFEVRDTGIGIAPGSADALFAPFTQADASTARRYGGSGLGLSISRKLVGMMDGELWLDSEPGVGSRFIFTARFGLRPETAGRAAAPALPPANLRALIVDDNQSARTIMLDILGSMHVESSAVAGGAAAIAELEAAEQRGQPYQVVLMDWQMPSMDGLEAIRRIRGSERISSTLAIIMVTAYSRDDLLAQARDVAMLGVLEKPVSPSAVLDALVATLGASGPATAMLPRRASSFETALKRIEGARVLLVEDNDINRELAVDILHNLGLRVDIAVNGEEALRKIRQQGYDAVLMDCQMPVMDGFQATRAIRLEPRYAQLPILAMTANAMVGDRELCLEAGMNEHIAKPIDVNQLAQMLGRWIARPDESGAAASPPAVDASDYLQLEAAGVDWQAGLATAHGNAAQYRKLLQQFHDRQSAVATDMRNALARGEPTLVRRHARNLAGLAAMLGARALRDAAARAEADIAAGGDAEAAVDAVLPPLRELLEAIGGHLQLARA